MRHASATSPPLLGVVTGTAVAVLCLAYAVVLSVGLLTLPSSDQQIQDPWFTIMELLIIGIAPVMLAFTVALHAWVPPSRKAIALLSVVFMSMCAVVTCSVHFAVLFLSREPAFTADVWARLVFSFTWPSVAYALDILAWDVFFPLAALFSALCIQGAGLAGLVRGLLLASAGFALFGLLGVPLANMSVRNIGIVGYAVLFPTAAALSAVVFYRAGGQSAA
jgi:hypothetical protein